MFDFQVIESVFIELLEPRRSSLSLAHIHRVQQSVDATEFSHALSDYAGFFRSERRLATSRERELVDLLARALSMDPAPLMAQLTGRVD